MLTFISNQAHYIEVLQRACSVKKTLWIGTADIKDLYVKTRKEKRPFLAQLAELIKKGVEVRLIHAKEPGPAFEKILINILCFTTGWSGFFVHGCISRYGCSIVRKSI